MLERSAAHFPQFSRLAPDFDLEDVQPPASEAEIAALEQSLGVPLPESYKQLLRCSRGFMLMDGVVQFGSQHPFFHEFEPLDRLGEAQRAVVKRRGGSWPPPSNGMLCFAEFFMEADGDQVLFDVSRGLVDGEYPVVYYAHAASPASVRVLARSFAEFMEAFLRYEEFADEDEE